MKTTNPRRNWLKTITQDRVYPMPVFRQRITEEISRARRNQTLVALVLAENAEPESVRVLRENLRPSDVVGLSGAQTMFLLTETGIGIEQRSWTERFSKMSQTILRLADSGGFANKNRTQLFRMGQQARRDVLANWTWEHTVDKMVQTLSAIANPAMVDLRPNEHRNFYLYKALNDAKMIKR